jgi:membrane-associated phospholipid phosphatase
VLTPWPATLLALGACLVIGVPLRLAGFDFNPLVQGLTWALRLSPYIAGGVVLRALIEVVRRRKLELPSRREALLQAASLAACAVTLGFMSAAYTWGKALVPYFNPRTWDPQLRAIDLAIHGGLDLNRFLLALLASSPRADSVIDWGYQHFYQLIILSLGWLLTTRDLDSRHRLLRGQVMLWLAGLAVYMLVPAVGPVFILQDLFSDIAFRFPRNAFVASQLASNYKDILRVVAGENIQVNIVLGTAAMPSLHVAMPAYCAFHCWERRSPLRTFYVVVTVLTLFASVVTGWHYAIDGYVGILIAALCWWAMKKPRPAGGIAAQPAAETPPARA